jgi:ribosomal protein S18 acetylase RimI-like enzyme
LEEVLSSRGYARFEPVSIQAVSFDELRPFLSETASSDAKSHVIRESQLKTDWLLAWLHLTNISIGHWANVEKLLGNILPAHCFLRLEEAGQTMAVGLAVYERGYVGLFDIVTNPAFRRQGWGRRLVVELLRWGQDQGASTAYLQVATPNTAALQLYAGFGFREIYRYWYRVKALAKI